MHERFRDYSIEIISHEDVHRDPTHIFGKKKAMNQCNVKTIKIKQK